MYVLAVLKISTNLITVQDAKATSKASSGRPQGQRQCDLLEASKSQDMAHKHLGLQKFGQTPVQGIKGQKMTEMT